MNDDSQVQEAPEASAHAAPEAPQSDAPQPEAATPSSSEEPTTEAAEETSTPEPQAGGDVSTTPATAPVPKPGVPVEPVNAEAKIGDVPGPRMEPGRIGEALKPPAEA